MRIEKRERLHIADARLNCEKKLETNSYRFRYIIAVILTKFSYKLCQFRGREQINNNVKIIFMYLKMIS